MFSVYSVALWWSALRFQKVSICENRKVCLEIERTIGKETEKEKENISTCKCAVKSTDVKFRNSSLE